MSLNTGHEEHDPIANLHMQPAKSILKPRPSIDDGNEEIEYVTTSSLNNHPRPGMVRSESKSQKVPHFDEMNIIATYHPADKDYGHMKIEEPKTPYAPNEDFDEEMCHEVAGVGIDPDTLAQRLNQSTVPVENSSQSYNDRLARKSIDEGTEVSSDVLEHRKQFEKHRKEHYNEFEVVRLRKKEIEAELRALEDEEKKGTVGSVSHESEDRGKGNEIEPSPIKPILVHSHSRDSSSSSDHLHHHVHVEIDHDDEHQLTPEERERRRQFELKRKKHYNEFRVAHMADHNDDEPEIK